MYGSIEAGGTKFVCAVGNEKLEIIERITFPTTKPKETMQEVCNFFDRFRGELMGIGVGSFGPIDIHENSSTYGYITSTPKIAWQNFDFVGYLKKEFNVPIAWTTDVNAAAYGEYIFGNGIGCSSLVYYTVGTGVGGGAIQNGNFIQGFSHPEMGHILVRRHSEDPFKGNCPFHGDCLEGLAAGPAIEKRSGKKGQEISEVSNIWIYESYYLAQCVYNATLQLSPDVVVLGGGVMKQKQLLEKIRLEFKRLVNGYVDTPPLEKYIVTPKLEDNAATLGCLALAKKKCTLERKKLVIV